MIKLEIIKQGDISFDIKRKIQELKNIVRELGEETAKYMGNTISSNVKRTPNEGVTERAIVGASHVIDENSYGVGEIALLQQTAPWWYVIDTGQMWSGGNYIPPYTKGIFGQGSPPNRNINNERMTYTGSLGYFVYPKKPIRPMNYIALTKTWLESYIGIYMQSKMGR